MPTSIAHVEDAPHLDMSVCELLPSPDCLLHQDGLTLDTPRPSVDQPQTSPFLTPSYSLRTYTVVLAARYTLGCQSEVARDKRDDGVHDDWHLTRNDSNRQ